MATIISYFKEAKEELKKVTWPNKKHLQESTAIVIIISVFFMTFLATTDYGLNKGLDWVIKHF